MDQVFSDSVSGRIEELEQLYGQLFLFLEETLSEQQSENGRFERSEALAAPIDDLCETIDKRFGTLRDDLLDEEDWRAKCDPEVLAKTEDFFAMVQRGLEAASDHVQDEVVRLTHDRDAVKDRLGELQTKKSTHSAYKRPDNPVSTLLDSEA